MVVFEAHEKVGSFVIIFPDEFVGDTVTGPNPPEIPIAVPEDFKTVINKNHIMNIIPLKVLSLELHNLVNSWLKYKNLGCYDWQVRSVTENRITRMMIFFMDLSIVESIGDMIHYCVNSRKAQMN